MFDGRIAGEFDGSATAPEIGLAMLGSPDEQRPIDQAEAT